MTSITTHFLMTKHTRPKTRPQRIVTFSMQSIWSSIQVLFKSLRFYNLIYPVKDVVLVHHLGQKVTSLQMISTPPIRDSWSMSIDTFPGSSPAATVGWRYKRLHAMRMRRQCTSSAQACIQLTSNSELITCSIDS